MLRNLGGVSFHRAGSDRGVTPDLCVGTGQNNWKLLSEHQGASKKGKESGTERFPTALPGTSDPAAAKCVAHSN